MQKSGKSIVANPKGFKLAGIGRKRLGGSSFFGTQFGNMDGYHSGFLYDNQDKRDIGQLMLDMISRIEQKAQQEEEII